MPSEEFAVILEKLKARPARSGTDIAVWRADTDERGRAFRPPEDVSFESVDAGGVGAEWITPEHCNDGTLIYFHGGGYCCGSLESHRTLAANIAAASGSRVLNVDYRLAPEYPCPAAVEDGVAAYRWLVDTGADPATIALGGDSAGGGLAVSAMTLLRDAGDPLPARAVLLCPWSDLTMSGESIRTHADAELIARVDALQQLRDWYLHGNDPTNPLASPVFADLTGLPPLLIHVGTGDILVDDGRRLAGHARACGVDAEVQVWDEMVHVWHAMAPILPEGRDAIQNIGAFLRRR